MAFVFNHLIHTYPNNKLRCSTPYTIKTIPITTRLELLRRPTFQTRIRGISHAPIVCYSASNSNANASSSLNWVETYLPERARPYANLMRLYSSHIGCTICTIPCLWAIAFTAEAGNIVDAKIIALFTVVGTVYRGIIVTANDILDRDVDAKVERTKKRPLASGELTLFEGISCLGLQMLLCYGLLLRLNDLSRRMWFASLVLAFTYPLMKRLTFWPQAYLGVLCNSFSLCGWSAVKGRFDLRILVPLCTSVFFWTMVYETIYSHQDKEADAKIGVKSPALLLGNSTKTWTSGFAVACISALVSTGYLTSIGWPYYVSVAAASIHLVWQILSVDLDSPADCYRKFESNILFGAIVLCGIVLGRFYQ